MPTVLRNNNPILHLDNRELLDRSSELLAINLKKKFPDLNIIFTPSKTILDKVKSQLKSLHVEDLAMVGNYQLDYKLKIRRGGVYGNIHFLMNFANTSYPITYAQVHSWHLDEAVLVADVLDLRNQIIEIDRREVSEFWIIARKIIAGENAKITYYPQENPNHGTRGRDGANGISYSSACQGGHRARRGGDGENGAEGGKGADGLDAPNINIFVLEIDSMPDIFAKGQRGGQGGQGGQGGDGGNGERGRSSRTWHGIYCTRRRGSGGHGGNGGDGGLGGYGGDGGDGATVTIATLQSQMSMVHTRPFSINIDGGMGGRSGIQGDAGKYGKGGKKGCDDDWICDDDAGSNGQNGQNGHRRGSRPEGEYGNSGALSIVPITEDDWNLKLEQPHITRLGHYRFFAGDEVVVYGMHFVEHATRLYLDGHIIRMQYHPNQTLSFQLPNDIAGGRHQLYVQTSDGDRSNEVEFVVRPYISRVNIEGEKVLIDGKSFLPDTTLFLDGEVLSVTQQSATHIEGERKEVIGTYAGGRVRVWVQNRDGHQSNTKILLTSAYLNSGFKPNPNGWAFQNYSQGLGEMSTFTKVFGADEVALQMFLHPILTPLYYTFFRSFLRNNGHCTGLSLRALEAYYRGNLTLFSDYPQLTQSLKQKIDIAQGRLLSAELLTHYGDQVDEGVVRVEKSLREIEDYLSVTVQDGSHARTLSFIPSGSIFDVENIKRSHTVVPIKLIYATGARYVGTRRSLDGARLYIYDNNRPNNNNCYLEIKEIDDVVHFSYLNYKSWGDNPMTLGTGTLKSQLFDDVDLPLNIAFVIDILMSPAYLRLEDSEGNLLGYKAGKIHTNSAMGYVCPWSDKIILSKSNQRIKRRILGTGEGHYTFVTQHPNGVGMVLQDIPCTGLTEDFLEISEDYSSVLLKTKESKSIKLSLIGHDLTHTNTLQERETKELTLHYESIEGQPLMITFEESSITIDTKERLTLSLESKRYDRDGSMVFHRQLEPIAIEKSHQLMVSNELWKDYAYIPVIK